MHKLKTQCYGDDHLGISSIQINDAYHINREAKPLKICQNMHGANIEGLVH